MGVKGLWSLLNPVARPVQWVEGETTEHALMTRIESMEGKRLAIDSSIWLYQVNSYPIVRSNRADVQFQATMRDKDGRVLVNAHVLGQYKQLQRICCPRLTVRFSTAHK